MVSRGRSGSDLAGVRGEGSREGVLRPAVRQHGRGLKCRDLSARSETPNWTGIPLRQRPSVRTTAQLVTASDLAAPTCWERRGRSDADGRRLGAPIQASVERDWASEVPSSSKTEYPTPQDDLEVNVRPVGGGVLSPTPAPQPRRHEPRPRIHHASRSEIDESRGAKSRPSLRDTRSSHPPYTSNSTTARTARPRASLSSHRCRVSSAEPVSEHAAV